VVTAMMDSPTRYGGGAGKAPLVFFADIEDIPRFRKGHRCISWRCLTSIFQAVEVV
jgi:hypothetical protein